MSRMFWTCKNVWPCWNNHQISISEAHYNDFYNDLKNQHTKKEGPLLVKEAWLIEMAERQGFEPWVEVSPHTRLAGERLQPTRPSLRGQLIGKLVD